MALISKAPLLLKAIKYIVLLPSKIRNYFNKRKWQKYQNDHRYDHFIDIDIHVWVRPHGSSRQTIKDAVHGATNQILLLIPEMSQAIKASYPEFNPSFSFTVIPRFKSNYIVYIKRIKADASNRILILSGFDKVRDTDYPLSMRVTKNGFGNDRVVIDKKFTILNHMYNY